MRVSRALTPEPDAGLWPFEITFDGGGARPVRWDTPLTEESPSKQRKTKPLTKEKSKPRKADFWVFLGLGFSSVWVFPRFGFFLG